MAGPEPGLRPIDATPPAEAAEAGHPAEPHILAQQLQARLAAHGGSREDRALLARTLAASGDLQAAADAWSAILIEDPSSVEAMVNGADARVAADGGVFGAEAQALLSKALAADPYHPKALVLAGRLAFDEGQWPLAAQRWEQALRVLDPRSAMAMSLRASLAELGRQMSRAQAEAPSGATAVR
jgi:cytochrome c-type biogenesis protein CcmH